MVKVIGYNRSSWTDKSTGEIHNKVDVYVEILDSGIEAGNIVTAYKFQKCIPLEVGEIYEEVTRPKPVTDKYGNTKTYSEVIGFKEI